MKEEEWKKDKYLTALRCDYEDIEDCHLCGVRKECRFYKKYKELL